MMSQPEMAESRMKALKWSLDLIGSTSFSMAPALNECANQIPESQERKQEGMHQGGYQQLVDLGFHLGRRELSKASSHLSKRCDASTFQWQA
jgi:hypothetical protein